MVALLLNFKLLKVLIDLFLFFVKNLILLHIFTAIFLFVLQIILYVFDVSLISFNNSSNIIDLFFLLFYLCIVLLDSVHQSFSSLWERQIHLVCLELQILFLFLQLHLLFP
jgi:hypothetical protein